MWIFQREAKICKKNILIFEKTFLPELEIENNIIFLMEIEPTTAFTVTTMASQI